MDIEEKKPKLRSEMMYEPQNILSRIKKPIKF